MNRTLIAIFILMLSAFACSDREAEQAQRDARQGANELAEKGEQAVEQIGDAVDDAAITSSVKLKLAQDEQISATHIDVDTENRVVTLKGTVTSQQQADRAVQIAKGTENVQNVISQLRVGQIEGKTEDELKQDAKELGQDIGRRVEEGVEQIDDVAADGRITAAVKLKLAQDERVSATAIDVDTKNGVVTLTGDVESRDDLEHALDVARSVDGVKEVVSNLRVSADPS